MYLIVLASNSGFFNLLAYSPNINFLPLAVTLLRSLRLLLAANAWLNIALFLADIADNAVFLAFAFKSFNSAFKIFVLTYNNC